MVCSGTINPERIVNRQDDSEKCYLGPNRQWTGMDANGRIAAQVNFDTEVSFTPAQVNFDTESVIHTSPGQRPGNALGS